MSRKFSAVVLTGGQSVRMGMPKAALAFGRQTILERIVAEIARFFAQVIIVAAPTEVDPYSQKMRDGVITIHDQTAYAGPLDALRRGIEAAKHEVVFACSCDLPLIDGRTARELCAMLDGYDAVIPKIGGRMQPLCAVYNRRCAAALSSMSARGVTRVRDIAQVVNVRIVDEVELRRFDPELRSFFNVNTREDYQQALRLAGLK